MLGLAAVRARPDLFSVYVGVGQTIHPMESERRGYAHTLALAREHGNRRALAELEAIAPYPVPRPGAEPDGLSVRHKWNARFGGSVYGYPSLMRAMLPRLAVSPDYGWRDAWHLISADGAVYAPLMDAITGFDACALGRRWPIPMVLIAGTEDWQVNHQLVRDWFDWIEAPARVFARLDRAAHAPMIERPDAFAEILVDQVRPLATGDGAEGPSSVILDEGREPSGWDTFSCPVAGSPAMREDNQ